MKRTLAVLAVVAAAASPGGPAHAAPRPVGTTCGFVGTGADDSVDGVVYAAAAAVETSSPRQAEVEITCEMFVNGFSVWNPLPTTSLVIAGALAEPIWFPAEPYDFLRLCTTMTVSGFSGTRTTTSCVEGAWDPVPPDQFCDLELCDHDDRNWLVTAEGEILV